MGKLKLLKLIFVITIIIGLLISTYQLLNPWLNNIQVVKENEVGIYVSPDGEKRITIYFNGGLLFHKDVTYVGVLDDSTQNLTKNIFLVAPNVKEVRWINNEVITVNGIKIAIDDIYDFRNE